MAQTDSLTGLANRRYFESYMKDREIKQKTFVYFDLDHFKQVNDTHGHEMGDHVLVQVAERMRQAFEDGFLVRLGGDEFLAVFLEEIPQDVIEKRVGDFIESLQTFFEHTDKMEVLSTSAGIAIGDGNSSLNELLRQSDFALYAAKRGGRACCRVYDSSMTVGSE